MRIHLACILLLFLLPGCGDPTEIIESPLTREVLERHLVDRGPVQYKSDDGWKWTCHRVYLIIEQISTDAEIRVFEKGRRLVGGGRYSTPRYKTTSRNATYHLKRHSIDDTWYVDTIDGKPIRKFGGFKIRLALKTGEFIMTEKPKKPKKKRKPAKSPATVQEDLPKTEAIPGPDASIDELREALTSLEESLQEKKLSAFPDTVAVKGGKEIQCEILAESADSIRIRSDIGTTDILRARIVSVTHATQQEKEEALQVKSECEELRRQRDKLMFRIRELELELTGSNL